MSDKDKQLEFWLINISKKSVNVGDLRITVEPYKSVNLLSKHYNITIEQLEKSCTNGSIFKLGHFLKIRKVAPVPPPEIIKAVYKGPRTSRMPRPIRLIEPEKYEELDFSDEKYASEDVDAAIYDQAPILPKK